METKFKLQIQVVYNLSELLHFKSLQKEKYRYELFPRLNYYKCHEMIGSFLWMQLNKKENNPHYHKKTLAQIVAQNFNK